MGETSDIELVRRARDGDVPAFELLYRRYNDRLYSFARQITGSADDARDVVQEAFVRAWNALPTLRSEESFGVWLHRIALNLSKDERRKKAANPTSGLEASQADGTSVELQIEADGPSPEDMLIADEGRSVVRRAIESLSEDHRVVVTMHHIEGMGVESIARVLGVRKGTVMSRLSRAREILRRKLAPYVEG